MLTKLCGIFAFLMIQIHDISPTSIAQLFRREKIIPHIIDSAPNETCSAIFKGHIEVESGRNYTKIFDFYQPPLLRWKDDLNSLYSVIMFGVSHKYTYNETCEYQVSDEPENYWLQWVVVNTPGLDTDSAREVYNYRKLYSTALPTTREPFFVIMLVYKQHGIIPNHKLRFRPEFLNRVCVHKYLKNELKLQGPIAANYFTLQALSSILSEDLEKNLNIDLTRSIMSFPDEDELKYAPQGRSN